jgi:hypothetical protein
MTCVIADQYSSGGLLPCLYWRFNGLSGCSNRRYFNFLAGAENRLSTPRPAKRTNFSSSFGIRIITHNDCLCLSDFSPRRLWYPEYRNVTCLLHTFVSIPYIFDTQVLLNIKNLTVKNVFPKACTYSDIIINECCGVLRYTVLKLYL